MKALSIQQPWAWCIINAGKDIENRKWKTKFRGRVLVHASSHIDLDDIQHLLDKGIRLPSRFEAGGIVGSIEIVDCVDKSDSKWFLGPNGLVLRNPIALPFMPLKGKLGLFEVPYEMPANILQDFIPI